jgi:hypothetical protein
MITWSRVHLRQPIERDRRAAMLAVESRLENLTGTKDVTTEQYPQKN